MTDAPQLTKREIDALLRACGFLLTRHGKPDRWTEDEWDALKEAEHYLDAHYAHLYRKP